MKNMNDKLIIGKTFLGDFLCLECASDKLNKEQKKHSKDFYLSDKEKLKTCVYCCKILG